MSDYRYQIVDHQGITSLRVMIDGVDITQTHIPIDDIETSIKRYRKENKTMGGRPSKGTKADKRLKENQPPKPPVKKG